MLFQGFPHHDHVAGVAFHEQHHGALADPARHLDLSW
jgi:hypothetical protein